MSRACAYVTRLLIATCLLAAPGLASPQAPTGAGTLELSVAAGASLALPSTSELTDGIEEGIRLGLPSARITVSPGSDSRWYLGGAGAYALNRDLLIIGEVAQTRLANPTFTIRSGSTTGSSSAKIHLLEVTAGIQYQVPGRSKVVPFVGGALGVARFGAAVSSTGTSGTSVDVSESDLTVNFGGGARMYFSPRWGVRPEIKVVHLPDETFVRLGGAVFFQFGSR